MYHLRWCDITKVDEGLIHETWRFYIFLDNRFERRIFCDLLWISLLLYSTCIRIASLASVRSDGTNIKAPRRKILGYLEPSICHNHRQILLCLFIILDHRQRVELAIEWSESFARSRAHVAISNGFLFELFTGEYVPSKVLLTEKEWMSL